MISDNDKMELFVEDQYRRLKKKIGHRDVTFCFDIEDLKSLHPLNTSPIALYASCEIDGETIVGKSEVSRLVQFAGQWEDLLGPVYDALEDLNGQVTGYLRLSEELKDAQTMRDKKKEIMFEVGCLLWHKFGIKSAFELSLYAPATHGELVSDYTSTSISSTDND